MGTIVLLLARTIGVPFVILAATGPLLQAWFRRTHPGRPPYRLYALSNVGSLLALLTYPILFEPAFTLKLQAWAWSAAYVAFVGSCGYTAWRMSRTADWVQADDRPDAPESDAAPAPGAATMGLWLGLSAAGSVMLLATTNQMCQDLAVVPFLWVLPLAVYLPLVHHLLRSRPVVPATDLRAAAARIRRARDGDAAPARSAAWWARS